MHVQVVFMTTRAPKVTWEAVYLPLVEAILYALAAAGHGMIRMGDGRVVPLGRMCSWLITCPVMLSQAFGIHNLEVWGVQMRMPVLACSIIRTVCGIFASVTPEVYIAKWIFFLCGCLFFAVEMTSVWVIFQYGIMRFIPVVDDHPDNRTALNRLYFMRLIFFTSW
jgi:bacteriorhodopsin